MEPKEKLKFVDENIGVLEISESSIVFTPPLYRQRYQKVKEKIESYSQGTLSKVLDFGCSDLKFFRYLRDITGVKEIVVLDKDEATLKDNIHHLKPMLGDFIMLRTEPLTVKAVCGDATVYNPVMKDAQVVTMIELIEHMYPSELPHLIDNVFKKLRPKLVIITTPNADFNQYIPDFVPGTFRHWDHKFEWSGEEFRNWCHGIVQDVSHYSVQITGCGLGPHDTYCTQMAVFIRATSDVEESLTLALSSVTLDSKGNLGHNPLVKCHYDILPREKSQILCEVTYPVDSRTPEEKDRHFILHRFHSLINYLQIGEDNQNYCLDWRESGIDEKNKNGESDCNTDHCDWSPIPMNSEHHNSKKENDLAIFRCLHVDKEDEIKKTFSANEFIFPIIKQKYAVLSMAPLSAWVNSEAEGEIPFNLIRSTVEEECYDCRGEGETWQGKTILWHDSSDDEDKREGEDGGDENYKILPDYDENQWACDTWESVNSVSPPVKQAEEDWEWGESDTSHGSVWGS